MCFLNMHVHKIYKLNTNWRKEFLFQISIISITALSSPPETLILCPDKLNPMTSASRAP